MSFFHLTVALSMQIFIAFVKFQNFPRELAAGFPGKLAPMALLSTFKLALLALF